MKYLYFICFLVYATQNVLSGPEPDASKNVPPKPRPLLGAKECTWGPSYWCSNLTAAAGCHAVRHCIQTVWEHLTVPTDTDTVCETCLKMVKEARDQLLSNETEEEIQEVFEGSCKLIPIKLVREECCKLVDDFVPELVDTLASQMNPQVVCSVAGLCNSARIDNLIAEYERNKPPQTIDLVRAPDRCEGCHRVIDILEERFDRMSKDEVLQSFLRVCGQMSSFSDACSNIVVTYFKEIYEHLQNNFDSDSICLLLGECSSQFHTHAIEITPLSKVGFVPVGQKDDLPCELCEQLVGHLRDLLVANTTEAEFQKVLQGLCNQTGQFSSECLSIVNEYYPIIYGFLVSELNGTIACEEIGICPKSVKAEDDVPITPLLPVETAPKAYDLLHDNEDDLNHVNVPNGGLSVKIMSKPETKPELMQLPIERLFPRIPEVYNQQMCIFCQYFLHYVQTAITNPATEEEIKKVVDEACEKLPRSINNTCVDFIDTYGDAAIALLAQEIDPSVICPLIKVCPSADAENVEVFHETKSGKDNCPLCLFAVTELEEMVKNDNTEANIRKALDSLCSHFSGSIAEECEDFVDTYTNTLIQMLIDDLKPQEVCVYLKCCNATATEKPLKSVSEIEDMDIMTNEIPDYTINGEIAKPVPKNSQTCIICEFAMDKLQKLLENKTTEDEIKDTVLSICNHLPKSVNAECTNFVNKYADLVIKLLINSVDPPEICSYMGLCDKLERLFQNSLIIDIPAEEPEEPKPTTPLGSPQCAVCKLIMTQVEKVIFGKTTKADIINDLYGICAIMPKSEERSCDNFIAKYGDAIADMLLAAEQPGEICALLMLCENVKQMIEDEITECSLCEAVYFHFNYLKQNHIKVLPEHVCNSMTKKYVKPCLDLLDKHAFAMSMYSSSDEDTTTVCQELEYCKGTAPYLRYKRQAPIGGKPLGADPCTWGPSYWCKSPENANKCGATSYCTEREW